MQQVLQVKNFKKSYKTHQAIDGLDFDLYEGEILGFLGPNGAGKSTTINILSTILKKDSGEIKFFNKDIASNLKYIKFFSHNTIHLYFYKLHPVQFINYRLNLF